MSNLKVRILSPVYTNGLDLVPSTPGSVGIDLRCCIQYSDHITILPKTIISIPLGIAVEPRFPDTHCVFLFNRGGLHKKGLMLANNVAVIDPDYRGELVAPIYNFLDVDVIVNKGERLVQMVMMPYVKPSIEIVDQLSDTVRGEGKYGHTGDF